MSLEGGGGINAGDQTPRRAVGEGRVGNLFLNALPEHFQYSGLIQPPPPPLAESRVSSRRWRTQ